MKKAYVIMEDIGDCSYNMGMKLFYEGTLYPKLICISREVAEKKIEEFKHDSSIGWCVIQEVDLDES